MSKPTAVLNIRPANAAKIADKELRRSAMQEVRGFIKDALPAEIYFMKDALVNWNSAHRHEDLGIAVACAEAIDNSLRSEEFIRVPEKRVAAVNQYLAALQTGEVVSLPATDAKSVSECLAVQLPRTMKISEDERAYVARLVRLLRENYWVAELVRQILDMEARVRHQITIKKIQHLLEEFSTLEGLARNARILGQSWSNHPIMKAIREEWPDVASYKDECEIRRLVESATKRAK
jgi:hypothetical protein